MAEAAPPRLDQWLAREHGISRHQAQLLITRGAVLVNGRVARSSHPITEVDAVEILPEQPALDRPEGQAVELVVVHEDDAIIVIDKPVGLVVHPAPGHADGTLADGLRQRGATWSLLGGADRPGIVHRLDRDTSGLLVAAKTDAAHRALAHQLEDRSLGRTYWTLVDGVIPEQTARITAPIGRDPRERKRMAIVDSGREAITDFAVMERLARHTLLDVSLRTGRTHQIRVHLSHVGWPVVGDPVYGRRQSDAERPRLALHARELRLLHPDDGRPCVFSSPLPAALVQLLARAREGEL